MMKVYLYMFVCGWCSILTSFVSCDCLEMCLVHLSHVFFDLTHHADDSDASQLVITFESIHIQVVSFSLKVLMFIVFFPSQRVPCFETCHLLANLDELQGLYQALKVMLNEMNAL